MVYESHSEEETQALGELLGRRLRGGEIVLLCGDLGVGKTQFAKGVGRALGVEGEVVSPTFTLAAHYAGRLPLIHYDLYRIEDDRELLEIGYLEPGDARAISLVEWGDRTDEPAEAVRVEIRLGAAGVRVIEVTGLELEGEG